MLRDILLLLTALTLLGWNAARFIDAKPAIRTKDLDFLPSGDVARLFALGHYNTVAKLRWIDSFAYFEKQIDAKDDRVAATGESTFVRLYNMVLTLDPKFPDYYSAATMNLGCIPDRHQETLAIQQKGIMELPGNPHVWQMTAAELKVFFKYEERQPAAFDAFLNAWYDAMPDPQQKQQVWDWKRASSRRQIKGLEQLPYWLDQLKAAPAQSTTRDFIVSTIREQITRYNLVELGKLAEAHLTVKGFPPVLPVDLLKPEILAQVYPEKRPPGLAIAEGANGPVLTADPYGWPYELVAGKPFSPGQQITEFQARVQIANNSLARIAIREKAWPRTLEAVKAAGLTLQEPPVGGTWLLEGTILRVEWPRSPAPAWQPDK